jgi:hypothetical protein
MIYTFHFNNPPSFAIGGQAKIGRERLEPKKSSIFFHTHPVLPALF